MANEVSVVDVVVEDSEVVLAVLRTCFDFRNHIDYYYCFDFGNGQRTCDCYLECSTRN